MVILFFPVLIAATSGRLSLNENIALGKPTSQSSEYAPWFPSNSAVDGINETDILIHACSHTNKDMKPWWTVDLQQTYLIYSLRITNRVTNTCDGLNPCADRLAGFEVHVSDNTDVDRYQKLCYTGTDISPPLAIDVTCYQPLLGQYVTLSIPRVEYLTLCEVEVYGKIPNMDTFSSSSIELSTEYLLSSNFWWEDALGYSTTLMTPTALLEMEDTQKALDAYLDTPSTVGSSDPLKDTQIQPGLIDYQITELATKYFEVVPTLTGSYGLSSSSEFQLDSSIDTLIVSNKELTTLAYMTERIPVPAITSTVDKGSSIPTSIITISSSTEDQLKWTVTQGQLDEISETGTESLPFNPLNTHQENICHCTCIQLTMVNTDVFMSSILTNLHIDKSNISRIRNRYACLQDTRPSARVAGSIGVFLFVLIMVGLLVSDIAKICSDVGGNTFQRNINRET